jgi:hypothetical protein
MTIQKKLTHNEIKMINELLDGQLNAEKAKQAFNKIQQDAALRSAYEQLRWTKSLLRQAPQRRVPHNFTLTRQMAREASRVFTLRRQTFSIAGAMASFLFVVLLAVQLLPFGLQAIQMGAKNAEDIAMMDAAEEPAAVQLAPEAPSEEMEMFAMEAAPVEEEAVVEEEVMEEAPLQEAAPTLSVDQAAGGGGEPGEGAQESMPADDTAAADAEMLKEEPEDQANQPELGPWQTAEEEQVAEAPLAREMPAEEEAVEQEQRQPSIAWLFPATVIAGLMAFEFIFISLRDKTREIVEK